MTWFNDSGAKRFQGGAEHWAGGQETRLGRSWAWLSTIAFASRFALRAKPDLGVCLDGAAEVQRVCAAPGLSRSLQALVADILERTNPADRDLPMLLDPPAEEELDRLCVLLSWMEYVFREGVPSQASSEHLSPLRAGHRAPDLAHLLESVPSAAVDDLRAVTATAQAGVFGQLRAWTTPVEVNVAPVFAGSEDVGGADADWLARGTLLDCKATMNPAKLAEGHALYQLACYPLLDYDDTMRITSVGIYLARQGQLIKWPLADLLARSCRRPGRCCRTSSGPSRAPHRVAPSPPGQAFTGVAARSVLTLPCPERANGLAGQQPRLQGKAILEGRSRTKAKTMS